MAQVIRVVVVDDDALVRAGIGMIMGAVDDISIIGEAVDGHDALDVVQRTQPDVVLMDIRMPVMDGLAATRALLQRPNPPAVLILTTFDADNLVVEALQLGAAGFLLKDTPPPRMIEAVRSVYAGEPALSPTVTTQLISAVTARVPDDRALRARADLAVLAERERDVAIAIGEGLSNAEIASQLFMSVATVKAYVTRILAKLGLDNRVQIAIKVHDADVGGAGML